MAIEYLTECDRKFPLWKVVILFAKYENAELGINNLSLRKISKRINLKPHQIREIIRESGLDSRKFSKRYQ